MTMILLCQYVVHHKLREALDIQIQNLFQNISTHNMLTSDLRLDNWIRLGLVSHAQWREALVGALG